MAAGAKSMNKSEMIRRLVESSGLTKAQVTSVLEGLNDVIKKQLGKKGPGVFSIPGLVKLRVVQKKATKAGMRPNPFKPGEMMEVKAKPARRVVRAVPLKALKDSVNNA